MGVQGNRVIHSKEGLANVCVLWYEVTRRHSCSVYDTPKLLLTHSHLHVSQEALKRKNYVKAFPIVLALPTTYIMQ